MAFTDDLLMRGFAASDAELGIVTSVRFHVYVRGASYERLAELTDWLSLELVLKFNDVGTWTLETSADSVEARLLLKTGGIIVTREIDGAEETIFSGFVWTEWGWTAKTFRASGYSDEALLWTPARPDPSIGEPPFISDYDVRTGQASSVMYELVNGNIGPAAPAGWAISALTFAPNPLLGTTITSRGNLQPILTLLKELAITPLAGGLGFYLRQSDTTANSLEFGVYAPPDKSADAKFSIDLGTAQEYEDIQTAPEATHVYVLGGDGFGANRTVIATSDADAEAEWGRRISTVVDKRGTTDTSELEQNAAETIAGAVTRKRAAITPFDVPSLQFGVDYDLGTLVTIVTHGGETVDLIRQVQLDLDPTKGPVITPIVGQGDGTDEEQLATITRTIQDRLSNVERNWNVPDNSISLAMMTANSVGTAQYIDGSLEPVHLHRTGSAPADGNIPIYDSSSGLFDWAGLSSLLADPFAVNNLTVAHDTILGTDDTDDLTVNATATFEGPVTFNDDVDLPVLFLDAGANRAYFGATSGLTGADDDVVDIVGGALHIASSTAGGTPHTVLGFRYGTTGTTFGIVIDAATDPILQFVDDGGSVVFRVQDASDTYQAQVVGKLNATGDIIGSADGYFSSQLAVGALAFSSTETLRVVGSSRLEGGVDITTGGLGVSGSGLFRDALTVQDGLTVQTGNFEVSSGDSLMDGDLHVTGGLTIDGGGSFGSTLVVTGGVSVTTGDVDLVTGYLNSTNGSGSSATISNWDGYVNVKYNGSIVKLYFKN